MRHDRVLITGSGGMLGNAVYPYFQQRYCEVLATDQDASAGWLEPLDVRDADHVRRVCREFRPDLILHLAANTNLEQCEREGSFADENNAQPSKTFAAISSETGVPLVYISTAGVFDGAKQGYYTEEDEPRPLMIYGQSKLDGEIYVREGCTRYYVVRAGWMVGGGPATDHKFVSRVLEQVVENREVIHAVNDKLGTPTYTHDFALNLFTLLEGEHYGTSHMVCEGYGTRQDVAEEIVRICGRDDIRVEGVPSSFFEKEFFAPRPRSEMMTNANLRALGLNRMRPWKVAVREYIEREFTHALTEERRASLTHTPMDVADPGSQRRA